MSTSVPFVLVDVFADTPLTGNPLAVVADAERPEEPVMRASAREFNQSETTFVLPATRPGATWRLRSFTPAGAEVVGAEHNALGAWSWLASAGRIELDAEGGAVLAQEIGDRVLPVEVTGRNGRPDAIVRDGATVLVEQGHAMGRPSRIRVQVSGQRVRIGGASVVVAEGTLTI